MKLNTLTVNGTTYDDFPDKSAVKTINGTAPDENGNVVIKVSGDSSQNGNGLRDTAKTLLITILRNAVYTSDQSANITALETALASGGSGDNGGDDSGSISVTKNGTTLIISGVSSILTVKQTGKTLAMT